MANIESENQCQEATEDDSVQDTAETSNAKDDDVKSKIRTITTDLPTKSKVPQESPHAIDSIANDASSKFTVRKLKELYRNHVVDAEKKYHLHFNFCLPTDGEIKDNEFDAAPMVLLIGQYSTGKTTFVSHLLGEDFPGMHIGPEPTTDKFMALFYGGDKNDSSDNTDDKFKNGFPKKARGVQLDDDSSQSIATDDIIAARGKLVKGNTLTVTPSLPFSSLSQFGSAFLNHFVGSSSASPLLKRITFIDTPGVLSGEKQRINRTYDFSQVAKWFADRSDLILLLFDAHKLDISDEFKNVIDTITKYNDDKIRCVLNKADAVTREQLVRVYGSLMWSMGKIFDSPEVVRVYTGSYWNGALINHDFESMFDKDEQLLVRELVDLPRCAAERKVNQMVNRIRLVKVHICILGTIRQLTPSFFGKKKARDQIINDLQTIMENVRVQFDLSKGDMPDPVEFARCLEHFPDFSVFPSIDNVLIRRLDALIDEDIPQIVNDAEIVASEVRLGRYKEAKEPVVDPTKEDEQQNEQEYKEASVEKQQEHQRGIIRSIIVFVCLLLIAQTAHFMHFDGIAYTPSDLLNGCLKIIQQSQVRYTSGPPFTGRSSHPTKKYTTNKSPHVSNNIPLSSFPSPTKTSTGGAQDEL